MIEEKKYKVLARKYRPQKFEDLVGQELLVKILSNHLYVDINFLGSETIHDSYLNNIDNTKEYNQLPLLKPNDSFNVENSDYVFLALPHAVSNKYVKKYFKKIIFIYIYFYCIKIFNFNFTVLEVHIK